MLLVIFAARAHRQLMFSSLSSKISRSFSAEMPPSPSVSNLKHYRWFFPPKNKALHFFLD